MKNKLGRITLLVGFVLLLVGCRSTPEVTDAQSNAEEVEVVTISLAGDLTDRAAEISGLAWYGDTLIILPQYPGIFPTEACGSIFAIPKADILAYLDSGTAGEITPNVIAFDDAGMGESIPGFEGFEAIGFSTEQVYLTIESESKTGMMGYLVSGEIQPELNLLQLGSVDLREIHPQADLDNYTDESILILDDQLITFYEANGANVNPQPVGHVFEFGLEPAGDISFPTIEYRITDVTAPDDDGRFWAINYLYSGDVKKLDPAADQIAIEYGLGASHANSKHVERLLEFQYADTGIVRTDRPPIQLQLLENGKARNWEGIVRLDDIGFLLMTDKHPETILAFVRFP